jgi:CRP/FNR family transcriptional regulator, nitrogen oxide reductase regulator
MEPFIPKRILWPHGPLRVLFSVLAVLSAVCLYFVTPRFAESPSLYATVSLILFVAEVTAFEMGVRHLKVSAVKNAQLAAALREEGDVLAERAAQNVALRRWAVTNHQSRRQNEGIQQFELLAQLTPSEFEAIVGAGREKRFSRGETIFTEGDPADHVMMVLSGFVKVTQMGFDGNEVILSLNGAGEIVGSYPVCANSTRSSTARAVQPCVALVWDAATFEKLLARIPTFRRNSVRALEQRLFEMEQRFREVSMEAGRKLSMELARLADRVSRRSDNGLLEISVSRHELAKLTGTTLFTVSRLLERWRQQGIVRLETRLGQEIVMLEGRQKQGNAGLEKRQEPKIVTEHSESIVYQYISAFIDLASLPTDSDSRVQ